MNKTTLLATACMLLFAAPLVTADEQYAGTFLGPGTLGLGHQDALSDCAPDDTPLGQGFLFALSGDAPGNAFVLTMDPTIDVDVWFYDDDCHELGGAVGAQGFVGETETGTIPAGATVAFVENYLGAGAFDMIVS